MKHVAEELLREERPFFFQSVVIFNCTGYTNILYSLLDTERFIHLLRTTINALLLMGL